MTLGSREELKVKGGLLTRGLWEPGRNPDSPFTKALCQPPDTDLPQQTPAPSLFLDSWPEADPGLRPRNILQTPDEKTCAGQHGNWHSWAHMVLPVSVGAGPRQHGCARSPAVLT